MGVMVEQRPARVRAEVPAGEPITLNAPPFLARVSGRGLGVAALLTPLAGGSTALVLALTRGNQQTFVLISMAVLGAGVVLGLVMFLVQRGGPRRQAREDQADYLDYLDELRRELREVEAAQRKAVAVTHPDSAQLTTLAGLVERRWERRESDPDFLELRVGVGSRPLARPLRLPAGSTGLAGRFDPVCAGAMAELEQRYRLVKDLPVTVALGEHPVVCVVGDLSAGRRAVRAMIAQLVTSHGPNEVGVAVVRHPSLAGLWDWLKWLPHAADERFGGPLPPHFVADSITELTELLAEGERPRPTHLVVVIDGESQPRTTVDLSATHGGNVRQLVIVESRRVEPERVDERIEVSAQGNARLADNTAFMVDDVSINDVTSLGRMLARYWIADAAPDQGAVNLSDVLGFGDPAEVDVRRGWAELTARELLRAGLGAGDAGDVVRLDLKEAALGGMGPHGLIVGATGTGKSELLCSLISSLAVRHPPEALSLLFLDFKGGATFAALAGLPHAAGCATNLEGSAYLVDRMRQALAGEVSRRERILAAHSNLPNIHAYHRMRAMDPALPPLPFLLVVIDEFSQLLSQHPDFAEVFGGIGQKGRSLGVHLLLSTPRLDASQMRGLEEQLSYRIVLRLNDVGQSRLALDSALACDLPHDPGWAYLKVSGAEPVRFKAPRVTGAYTPATGAHPRVRASHAFRYQLHNGLTGETLAARPMPEAQSGPTTLSVITERIIAASGRHRTPPVWLPPLPEAIALNRVPEAASPSQGLSVVFGLLDDPARQHQGPMLWEADAGQANLAVVGAPQSGKSTLLQTIVLGLARRYSPQHVACYAVDFSGNRLAALAALPHVAAAVSAVDAELLQRTVSEVHGQVLARQQAPGRVENRLVLVVDGWDVLRNSPDAGSMRLVEMIAEVCARGPSVGVHTIVSATNPAKLGNIAASLPSRVELRLSDPMDSASGRAAATVMRQAPAGRVLLASGQFGQAALPRFDGRAEVSNLDAALFEAIQAVTGGWGGSAVAKVEVLAEHVATADLPGDAIGLSGNDLRPVRLDLFERDPHLLIYGDKSTGKSNLIRLLLRQLSSRPNAVVTLFDPRREHLDEVDRLARNNVVHCTTAALVQQGVGMLVDGLRQRLPGPAVTREQLRARSWWSGSEMVLLVDDYQRLAGTDGALARLAEFVQHGREVGFHLVAARATLGALETRHDPIFKALNDEYTPAVLFAGDPLQGRLAHNVQSRRDLPPGRALLARHDRPAELVQVAYCPARV